MASLEELLGDDGMAILEGAKVDFNEATERLDKSLKVDLKNLEVFKAMFKDMHELITACEDCDNVYELKEVALGIAERHPEMFPE